MLSHSLGMPSRREGPPSIWDTHGFSGNFFRKSNSVFFSTLSSRIESMELQCIRTHITTCDESKPNTSSGSEMPVRTGVRISHGSNKLVMNLNNNEQAIPEVEPKEYAFKLWMRRILHADRRPKKNRNVENLLTLPHEQLLLRREIGSISNQGNILSPIMKYRRK